MMQTTKPLLYYDPIFRAMLSYCELNIGQYAEQVYKIPNSLRKLSSAMHLHLVLGLMELVLTLDDHYTKGAEAFSIKVAVAHVHQWF